MLPYLTYKKSIYVDHSAYELFVGIENLDLTEKFLRGNAFDLIASVRSSNPLVIKFISSKNDLGIENRILNATVWAGFENVGKQTRVDIEVRSNILFMIFSSFFGVSWIASFFRERFDSLSFIAMLFLIIIFMGLDILAKRNILTRIEKLIYSI